MSLQPLLTKSNPRRGPRARRAPRSGNGRPPSARPMLYDPSDSKPIPIIINATRKRREKQVAHAPVQGQSTANFAPAYGRLGSAMSVQPDTTNSVSRIPSHLASGDISLGLECISLTREYSACGRHIEVVKTDIHPTPLYGRDSGQVIEEIAYEIQGAMTEPPHTEEHGLPHGVSISSAPRWTRDEEDQMLHAWAEERVTGFFLRSTALQGATETIARAHPVQRTLYYDLLRYKCEIEINDRCEQIGRFAPCYVQPVILDDGCMLYGKRLQDLPRPGSSPLRLQAHSASRSS